MNQKKLKIYIFYFLRGARPGTASGCFKRATETPNAGLFLRGKGIFREKTSIPANTGIDIFEIPVLYRPLKIQYRIGNTTDQCGISMVLECLA
jgi:restriction endonuclease S subunit